MRAADRFPVVVESFGSTIRAMRHAKEWTQDRAADEFGCLRNQISDYERERRRPNLGRVRAMARAYGDDSGYLEALWRGEQELALARREIALLREENDLLRSALLTSRQAA